MQDLVGLQNRRGIQLLQAAFYWWKFLVQASLRHVTVTPIVCYPYRVHLHWPIRETIDLLRVYLRRLHVGGFIIKPQRSSFRNFMHCIQILFTSQSRLYIFLN